MSGAELDTFTTFGELLRHLRLRARLTQRELGLAVGYTDAHITRLENGQRLPDPSVVRARFLDALDLRHEQAAAQRLIELAAAADSGLKTDLKPPTEQSSDTHSGQRTNLRVQLTRFIGREHEIAEVIGLVSANRMVTLIGSGGVGKTRLAIEVGTWCFGQGVSLFTHGVWLAELASVADPTLASQAVMNVFSLREEPSRTILDVLTAYLANKRLLLILDNCEHMVGTCADMAQRLVSACPHLHILATSREALRVPGEIAWRVPPLSTPDLAKLPPLQQALEYEAIELFINRAASSRPGFVLSNSNMSAVAHICRRLDGIPLAIELAASRLQSLSVEEIASRLDDRFRLLTSGSRTASLRHQTLRTLIDWSYDLLSKPEKVLLERLAVFAGGWTLEAAERVCNDQSKDVKRSDVLPLLLDLVSKSLVNADEREDEARYRLLETVRIYALEKLMHGGELEAIRHRHAETYLALVEHAEPHFHTRERRKWFDRIERELDNIRAAMTWSKSEDGDVEISLRLVGALWPFWWWRGSASEGGRWIEELLPTMKTDIAPRVRARALLGACALLKFWYFEPNLEKTPQIEAWLEEALRLFHGSADQQGIAYALCFLSLVASNQNDLIRALSLLEDSLLAARQLGNPFITAYVLRELAGVATEQQDLERAKAIFDESLSLARKDSDEREIAANLIYLSNVAFFELDFILAERLSQKALQVARQAEIKDVEQNALHQLGEAARFAGDLEKSKAFFEEMHALSLARDDDFDVECALHSLGKVAYDEGNYKQAQDLLIESLVVARTNNDWMTPFNLEWLASVAGAQSQPIRAAQLFGAAEAIRETQRRPLPVNCVEEYERHVAVARAQLDEAVFAAAWTEGKAMTPDQAVEYALDSQSVIHTQPN